MYLAKPLHILSYLMLTGNLESDTIIIISRFIDEEMETRED